MTLKAFVPFVTYPDANSDAIAMHAVSFAAAIGASIHALAIEVDIPDISNALSKLLLDTPEMIRRAETMSYQRGVHLLATIKAQAIAAGVETTTGEVAAPLASLGDIAASNARYFDLSLIGWEPGNPTSRATAEAVIFGSGRPVIMLPELSHPTTTDHIAIAWDGGRAAARAVADAQFLLQRAERISILTVMDEKPLDDEGVGNRLADRLREQGADVQAFPVQSQDSAIGETLQQSALGKGCKLLVMGGYGHSRIRDFMLGGATRGVLDSLLLPVLLSH